MKVVFHSIRFKNFLSVGDNFEKFDLDKSDFTVIVGKNGSGKSTILDALTYVLYKKPYRPRLKLGQLINNVNRKKMLVEIAFSIGKTNYVVRRGEKPKVFEIYRDKELIEPDPSVGDYQQQLENIIGQNFKTFCQINVIGKATYTQFMDLSAAERRTVVEDVLDSSIYSIMADLGKAELKDLNLEDSEISKNLSILENNISNTKAILARYESDKTDEINNIQSEITNHMNEYKDINEKYLNLDSEIKAVNSKLEELIPSQHLDKFKEKLNEYQGEISVHKSVITRTTNLINKIDSLELCPHCLQDVDDNHKNEISTKNKQECEDAKSKLEAAQSSYDTFSKRYNEYNQIKDKIQSLSNEKVRLGQKRDFIKETVTSKHERIKKLQEKTEIPELPNLDDLSNEKTILVKKQDKLIAYISKLKSAIKLLGDDGIKANLINKYIPIINKTLNEYLELMNLFVEFTLDSEFNEKIEAINRDMFTYSSFSEGQKMRIDLAILLTWRHIARIRNSMTTNIFFLDEIADGSLDDDGMVDFLAILKTVSDAQNTFIISHKDTTIDQFNSVIRAETIGNFTSYTHE